MGQDELVKVLANVLVRFVVIAADCGVLDGAVDALDLAVSLGMVRHGEPRSMPQLQQTRSNGWSRIRRSAQACFWASAAN